MLSPGLVARGKNSNNCCETRLSRLVGITFPGNWVADKAKPEALKTLLSGSKMLRPAVEKSPERMRSVPTEARSCVVFRSRSCSQFDRKKSLFLPLNSLGIETGPPRVKPYWLRRNGFFVPVCCHWRASIAEFRRNSYAVPWYSLPPDLVV